jgi:predicted ArsR family transcriptional regulator
VKEEPFEPPTGKQAEVTMADILTLPDELRTIVIWLMQQREAELPELAAFAEQDEAITRTHIAELVARGFVQEMQSQGEGQTRYQVRLATRRARKLPDDL